MTFAHRFRRITSVWAAFALASSYWIAVPFLDNNPQTEWIRVAMVVFAGATLLTLIPAFRSMFIESTPSNAQQSIVGQVLILAGILGSAIWLLLWRAAGFPVWMVQSDLNGFFLWLILIGSLFSLVAPKDHDRVPPRTRWERVYLAAVLTIILGYTFIVLRPDVKPFVEGMKPYLSTH